MAATKTPSTSAKVDAYLAKHAQWQEPLEKLRKILLASTLEETVKWGSPAYCLNDKVVVSLVAFKQHCALWFHQGALLKDQHQHLVNAQEGVTKAMRQWRFEAGSKINATQVKAYVREAIANQANGIKIIPAVKTLKMPDELAQALQKDKVLAQAFAKLTPGKQREYADHVSSAKQESTRHKRALNAAPLIKRGVGLHDKYR